MVGFGRIGLEGHLTSSTDRHRVTVGSAGVVSRGSRTPLVRSSQAMLLQILVLVFMVSNMPRGFWKFSDFLVTSDQSFHRKNTGRDFSPHCTIWLIIPGWSSILLSVMRIKTFVITNISVEKEETLTQCLGDIRHHKL